MSINKTLLLTSCTWEDGKYESFRLIPISIDSPYIEVIYDPLAKVLVLFAKDKKEHFAVLDQLNEFGEAISKDKKPLVERHRLAMFKEFYIHKNEEIIQFLELLALNASQFDYNKYLQQLIKLPVKSHMSIV